MEEEVRPGESFEPLLNSEESALLPGCMSARGSRLTAEQLQPT